MNQPPNQPGPPPSGAPGPWVQPPPPAGPPPSPYVPPSPTPSTQPVILPPPPPAHDRGTRGGALTAGVWLISLGLVFLVRDWAGWSWGEAWPLFIIAAGVASLIGRLLRRASLDVGAWSLLWPITWIVIGALVLGTTTGELTVGLGDLISRWWPVGLILVGAWFLIAAIWPGRRRPLEQLALPLGGSPVADIRLRFGAGVIDVGRAAPGALLTGTFQGGARYRTHGPDAVELEPDTGRGWPASGPTFRWDVRLTGEKPLDLRLDTGASRASIDLSELLVRQLELQSGAADTRVRLPRAAGVTVVRTQTGVASLSIEVPQGVAARIRSSMALGRVDVDTLRFPRTVNGFESADFGTAPNRVEVDVRGGVGSVTIR